MEPTYYKDLKVGYFKNRSGGIGYVGEIEKNVHTYTVKFATFYSFNNSWDAAYTVAVRHEDDSFGYIEMIPESEVTKQGIAVCPLSVKPAETVLVWRQAGKKEYMTAIPVGEMLSTDSRGL